MLSRPVKKRPVRITGAEPPIIDNSPPKGAKSGVPLWQQPEIAMKTTMRFLKGMDLKKPTHYDDEETKNDSGNLHVRLRRIRLYNESMHDKGLAHHMTTEDELKLCLVRSGYDHNLSDEAFT